MKIMWILILWISSPVLGGLQTAWAAGPQQAGPPRGPNTLKQAVKYALANYPAIQASMSQLSAAASGIDLARTAYLPRTDLMWQANRATRNNIFGLLLPNSVLPSISGPALAETTYNSTWGSAAGALFSWEPFDFGLRGANVRLATAVHNRARAGVAVSEFEVALGAVDAFLALLAAQETVKAARANVERNQVFTDAVAVLVKNELQPGADESRARAELALARTGLFRAEQQAEVTRATLAEWMGLAGKQVQIEADRLLGTPPLPRASGATLETHPIAVAQTANIELVHARQQVLDRSYYPRFDFQSAFYGRGSGANIDGTFQGGLSGLATDRANWAVGLSVTFPLFDFASIRAKKQIEEHNERAEYSRYAEVVQQLTAQIERARAQVEGARRIAQNTPVQLEAARVLEQQARARYQAGLATVTDVAEAQRLLTQSEIDDALARLEIWRALFAQAAAEGDMSELVEQSSR
ncbi:TolC family protein [Acidobacteria bacterium AH-259-O06]|nr:TolC family protein [Acidobacteria bacterium AH-259-O06]